MPDLPHKAGRYKPTIIPRTAPTRTAQHGSTVLREEQRRKAREMGQATGRMLGKPRGGVYTGK